MNRYPYLALFLLIGLFVPASAEQPDKKQDKKDTIVFRVNVQIVQVDAVVTDMDDRPVTDLTAEDFIILQDGKPQEITNFSLVRTPPPERPRPAVIQTISKSKNSPAPPPPPVKFNTQKLRRTIALVVDDLGLSFSNIVHVREALKEWVNKEMQPGDLVAVIQTGVGLGSMQQFTSEKRMLLEAIRHINYNVLSRVGSTSFAPRSGVPLLERPEDQIRGITMGTMGAIRYVVNGLENLPGRKSLILFSENLKIQFDKQHEVHNEPSSLSKNNSNIVDNQLYLLIEAANRAAVVIHTIDPRGVPNPDVSVEDTLTQVGASAMAIPGTESSGSDTGSLATSMNDLANSRMQQLLDSRDGLAILSQKTGGLFLYNRNIIDKALVEASKDGEVYYLIGYQPDEKTIAEMEKGKTRYHDIKVRVKRPGLRVRSRSGFFSAPEEQSAPLTRRDRMVRALASPFAPGDLRVRLTTLYSQTRDNKPCINALLHFDADRLTFSRGPDGEQTTVVDIMGGLYDAEGKQIDSTDRRWNLTVKAESLEYVKRNGLAFLMRVPVKEAGAYQMRVVLSDAGKGEMGSATHYVEVPPVDKGNLSLSGIAIAADTMKPKAAGEQEEGILSDREVNGTPAVRVFQSGETVAWAYQIINAKAGKDNKSQLQTYVRLFHDGQEVFEAEPTDLTIETQEEGERLIGAGRMHLKRLSPGDYALQVIVLDMLAKEKNRMAEQSIDFEVQDPALTITGLAQ
jgi:VWFA-related protein